MLLKRGPKFVSLFLVLIMAFNLLTTPVSALMMESSTITGMKLTTGDGSTITVDESWEDRFPYGTFAFETGQVAVTEGADAQTIKVYRLGGTKGKAQVTLSLTPVVTETEEEEYSFANAAGINDFIVEVEDMLPIAQYQVWGMDAPPLKPDDPVTITGVVETANVLSDDGETVIEYGNTILTANTEADSYRWQAYSDGKWVDVEGNEQTLDVSNEAAEMSDFRCIYTVGGQEYGTDSLWGEEYEPVGPGGGEIPEGIDLAPEQSFHTLELNDGEYDTYEFYMTFAEGEWVKEIQITPVDDELPESVELVALKMESAMGGELYDTANTLLFAIEDNEEALPSSFFFKTQKVVADKASGSAFLTVERTGGLQYVATVDYKTVSGTAVPGIDYSDTDGTLYFAGGVSEMTIEIPLINDGITAEEADLEFSVELYNPLGGKGTEIIGGASTVSLYNTAEAEEKNLATMLYTPDADDVSGDTNVTSNAIAPLSGDTILATPVKHHPPVAAELISGSEEGEIGTLDYNATAMRVNFDRSAFPLATYWSDFADLGGMGNGFELNNNQNLAFKGWDDNQIKTVTYNGQQWAYRSVECGSDYSNRDFWNTQTFADFDQLFQQVTFRYRADTDTNWGGDKFASTVFLGVVQNTKSNGMPIDPQPYEQKVADGYGKDDTGTTPNYVNTPRELSFPVKNGAKGIFVAFGDRDSGWASTGTANAKIWLQSKATRRYLKKPLQYVIHTADDDTIKALGANAAMQVYEGIAPSINMAAGEGGTYLHNNLYVGSRLTFSRSDLNWSTYQFAQQNESTIAYPIYLSSVNTKRVINTGSVNSVGSLSIIGRRGWSFASGFPYQLSDEDTFSVNLVFDRQQKIAIDISKSVPRGDDGRTIDINRIDEAMDTFWSRANITVNGAEFSGIGEDALAGSDGAKAIFEDHSSYLGRINFGSGTAATTMTSNLTYNNIKSINFGLPATDQILFNGVLYNGDEDIPIPVSMFGMNTIAFTYYHADYLTATSDMTMTINRIEQYIDANGNGRLDGFINQYNQFETVAVGGKKDMLVAVLTEEEYAISKFTPVEYEGQTRQQFFKFYYSLSPACLSVPTGAEATDRAQILPAFVNAETDESRRAALSNEMRSYRFIQSGQYSNNFSVRNNKGEITITHEAGQYSADGKLMYGPEANAIETVDIPIGGDYSPIAPTYVYSNGSENIESKEYDPNKDEANGWYISDVKFKRSDWDPDYRGSLLYKFADPEAIFVSDPLVGEALPVADLVSKASSTQPEDKYDIPQLNNYLGSLNPVDAVMIGVRKQELTSGDIIGSFEGLSLLGDVIQSGEHVIAVDSVTFGGFSTIPDASGLRKTAGPEDGAGRTADSGNSSNSNPEFNMDLGIEMPSLSVGLTDFVTLIVDGEEFGFSIGIPIFSMEKKAENYSSYEESMGHPKSKYGSWEKKVPGKDIAENAGKVKNAFTNPGSLINSDEWKAAKNKANQLNSLNQLSKKLDPKADTDKAVKSKGMGFSIAVNVTVMFKWSAPDHAFKFSSAMVFLQIGFQYKQTIRLTVCPIVYAYFCVGVSLEVAGGVVNEREVVENKDAAIDINKAADIYGVGAGGADYRNGKAIEQAANLSTLMPSTWEVKSDEAASGRYVMAGEKGDAFTFWSKSDALNLYFSGKVKIEVLEDGNWKNLGYVASDGTGPVFIMFDEKVDGNADLNVRITVLDEAANFDRIIPISGVRNETFFSGLTLSPAVFLEVGAGIGVEVLKVEVYFKASIGISMSFATRPNNAATKGTQLRDPSSSSLSLAGAEYSVKALDDTISALDSDVEAFSFDSFTFRAGFGVRVVILLFNFELDVIQFGIDYRKSMDKSKKGNPSDGFHDNGWKFAWYALNGGTEIGSHSLSDIDDSEGFPGVKITLPSNTFAAQQLYGPENAQMVIDEINAMAFDPENLPTNEFQISGYSSSGDAFRLADNLATGTDYKLLTVGTPGNEENYLLYTISRKNPEHAVDSNMLVLSKLQNTGENIGLVNPVDPENTETPYIVVDTDGTGNPDNTGDLDFSASVSGNTINVVWVSYKTATSASGSIPPVMPDASVPRPSYVSGENTIYMDGANYKDVRFLVNDPGDIRPPEPDGEEVTQEPEEVAEVPEPTEPVAGDYFMKADAYDSLEAEEKAKYKSEPVEYDNEEYHIALAYDSFIDANAAYESAMNSYNTASEAYGAYLDYIAELAAWQAWENYRNYPAKKAAYDAYIEWYNYYDSSAQEDANERELLNNASQNTELKTASFTVGTEAGFSGPEVISGTGTGYLFQPRVSDDGKLAFYARSNNFNETEKTQETNKAKEYYDASKGDFTTGSDGVSSGEGDPTAAFRYAYTTSMNDVYGKNTQFMFAYNKDGVLVETGFTPNGWDALGMRLTNSAMTMIDDSTFYLAYTASVTETTVNGNGSFGDTTVHKLYLQKGSVNPSTGAVTLDNAKMLRQLVDINGDGFNAALLSGLQTIAQSTGDSTKTADGVYVNNGSGAKQSIAFEDPYFGNVRFLKGKLGNLAGDEEDFGESLAFTALDAEMSTFLLFEMNGNTYVVPEASLDSITGTGRGMIIPFWETDEKNRTRSNVVIGADGDGNITAVYTDAVAGTTNNALYVSKYDPETTSFGIGRMLAMNYMQVYEDGVANGWTEKEMEEAFYGKRAGYNNGGMSTFTFSNLDIALGIKKGEDPDDKSTLVIVTQGTQVKLMEMEFAGPEVANSDGAEEAAEKVIVPEYKDGVLQSTTGYYAISFGVGEKAIGEGKILFPVRDFTPGAILQPTIEFKNTGDVPLRASRTAPITLQLWLSGQPVQGAPEGEPIPAGTMLGEWKIETGIAVGQVVRTGYDENLEGLYTNPLPNEDLAGRRFYFTVSETAYSPEKPDGVDKPLEYSSLNDNINGTVRVIEARPELAVENVKFSTVGVEGDKVQIAVSMAVTNRGAADAAAPYLQFTHQTGRTMEEVKEGDTDYQKAIYGPLDISESVFEISKQTPISALDASTAEELSNGILRLVGTDPTEPENEREKLAKGNARTVEGTFWVSKDAYCLATATGSLNIKVEVFNGEENIDSLSSSGTQTSMHDNEYDSNNNSVFSELDPVTLFTAPARVTVPLSTTMRLSVPAVTTEKGNPVITVKELNLEYLESAEKHLGILYYNMGADGTGKNGYLVISPSSEGSGVIRVIDSVTGSYTDIAFTVTKSGSGVNIFRDNNIFTWYNALGRQIDPEKDSGAWSFRENISTWGDSSSNPDNLPPYLSDLSRSLVPGVSFTFITLAEEIDLYFNGTASVSCEIPGFRGGIITASGGNSFATIELGENPTNAPRRVKITATAAQVDFDRMVERFAGGRDILPDPGSKAPQIWFSRSLPETASLKNSDYEGENDGFVLTAYVLDETGIASLTFDQGTANATTANPKIHSSIFRQFDIIVRPTGSIGTFTINAMDESGQSTSVPVMVDWFNTTVNEDNVDEPLSPFNLEWVYRSKQDGAILDSISETQQLKKDESAFIKVNTAEGATAKVEYYSIQTITEDTTYQLVERSSGVYKLVKTVRRTDETGSVIGSPEVTETDATAETVVPSNTQAIITNAEWKRVEQNPESLEYPVDCNAVYKVTAAKDGVSATRLFLMNRLNTDAPSLEIAYISASADDGAYLSFIARKGASSSSGIVEISINNYVVYSAEDTEYPSIVSGEFPISYGGEYRFTVTDAAGNEGIINRIVTLPVQATGNGFLKIEGPYGGLSNGRVTIDSTDIFGGVYDSDISDLGANVYENIYEYALVGKADAISEADEGFDTYISGLAWQPDTQFSGLGTGDYVLYIRDKQDTSADLFIYELTVEDGTVEIDAQVIFDYLTKKASITVTAENGGGVYEFIAIPRTNGRAMLTASEIEQAITDYVAEAWIVMEDAVSSAKAGIVRAKTALEAFKNAISTAKAQDIESKIDWSDIDSAVANAESAVDPEEETNLSRRWDAIDQLITDEYSSNPDLLPSSEGMTLLITEAAGTAADYLAALTDIESAVRSAIQADNERIVDWTETEQTMAALKDEDSTLTQARSDIEDVYANRIGWQQSISGNTCTWNDCETGWYQIAVRDKEEPANMASKSVYGGILSNGNSSGTNGNNNGANTTGLNISGYTVTTPTGMPAVTDDAGNRILPGGGSISMADGSVINVPGGTTISSEGVITVGAGGATITLTGGEGTGSGNVGSGDTVLILPSGTSITNDGTVSTPAEQSAVVTLPVGLTMNLRPGLTLIIDTDAPLGYYALFDNPFTDVGSDAWYNDDVAFAYTHGLFNGTAGTAFSPAGTMTRGMLMTVLGRLHGIDTDEFKDGAFSDVKAEAYYAAYVQWAYEVGIVKGTGEGLFAPDAGITRQDLAVILYRFMQLAGIALPKKNEYTTFSDSADIADYAREAIEALYRAGIINGKSGNQFDPKGQATRAEVAAMLHRFILEAGKK